MSNFCFCLQFHCLIVLSLSPSKPITTLSLFYSSSPLSTLSGWQEEATCFHIDKTQSDKHPVEDSARLLLKEKGPTSAEEAESKMRFVSTYVVMLPMMMHEHVLGFSSNFGIIKPSRQRELSVKLEDVVAACDSKTDGSRRRLLQSMPAIATFLVGPQASRAVTPTGSSDGNLPELPTDAVRSYLQYRVPLQISADYYVFDLQRMVGDVEQW